MSDSPFLHRQFLELIEVIMPDGSVLKLTNLHIAKLTHTHINTTPRGYPVSATVSKWVNGERLIPPHKFELLAWKVRLLREGIFSLDELCSNTCLHEAALTITRTRP